MIDLKVVDEAMVDGFRQGYSEVLIRHFTKKFGWTETYARQVLRDTVRFLAVCAVPPGNDDESWEQPRVMVSSKVIDEVVDEIFLNTPLLVWLEANVLHVRLYHVPSYEHGTADPMIMQAHYDFTVTLMKAAGYLIDEDIWPPQMAYSSCTIHNDLEDCQMFVKRL